MTYQVNVEFILPTCNLLMSDSRVFMNLEECKEFIELVRSIINTSSRIRLKFTVWRINKQFDKLILMNYKNK